MQAYFANFGQPPHLGNPYIKIIKSVILYNSAQICIMRQILTTKYNGDIFRTHVCQCMSWVSIRNNISQRNKHYNTVCRNPTKHQYYSRHRNTINNSGSTQHHKYNIHAVSQRNKHYNRKLTNINIPFATGAQLTIQTNKIIVHGNINNQHKLAK